jgi:hypothetical protein
MKLIHVLLLALLGGLFFSCERHKFDGPEGTRQLNEPHPSKSVKVQGEEDKEH